MKEVQLTAFHDPLNGIINKIKKFCLHLFDRAGGYGFDGWVTIA
jgi:hypothetical protein